MDWKKCSVSGESEQPHSFYTVQQIVQFQKDPKIMEWTILEEPPDGPSIGTDDDCEMPQ